jgi:hypothetical protein
VAADRHCDRLSPGVWGPGVARDSPGRFLVNLPLGPLARRCCGDKYGQHAGTAVRVPAVGQVRFRVLLKRFRDALALILLAALGGMTVSATIGSSVLVLAGAVPDAGFWPTWLVWWAGDAISVLVVAPLLLGIHRTSQERGLPVSRLAEAGVLLVSTSVVAVYATRLDTVGLFLAFPMLIWAALQFQLLGAAPCVLVVSVAAILAAAPGEGAFASGSLSANMIGLQEFNGVVALSTLLLAVVVGQSNDARLALERARAELEDRVRDRTAKLTAALEDLLRSEAETTLVQRALARSEEKFRRCCLPHQTPSSGSTRPAGSCSPTTGPSRSSGTRRASCSASPWTR